MGLRSEVEDCIHLVLLKTCGYVGRAGYVALKKAEIVVGIEDAVIIQCRAIVEFVEANDPVLRIRQDKMADQPRGTEPSNLATSVFFFALINILHKPSTTSDHDSAHIGQRIEFGSARKYRRILPNLRNIKRPWDGLLSAIGLCSCLA